uniref:Uncharacterized protein n=1 Tax=Nymphaea colorata TaxID=210225 RepID=A0A5K0VG31_9MAGN
MIRIKREKATDLRSHHSEAVRSNMVQQLTVHGILKGKAMQEDQSWVQAFFSGMSNQKRFGRRQRILTVYNDIRDLVLPLHE